MSHHAPLSAHRLGHFASPAADLEEQPRLRRYIRLKLAALGFATEGAAPDDAFDELTRPLLAHLLEKDRILAGHLAPADQRIQSWLDRYLTSTSVPAAERRLPSRTFVLDRHGLARLLALPPDRDEFVSPILTSYRVHQGILHNPKADRRTTAGVFHVAEGGLPIPGDKVAIRRETFARLLAHAMRPPPDLALIPFTATQSKPAVSWVSLLLRPVVQPEIPGVMRERSLEVRFFAPGTLVANLDFVESIFGNAGDPFLPENDAALDPSRWTGHTGCVILATHLTRLTKRELGCPSWDEATERQRRDGQAWKSPDELYNNGQAFKACARDASGVVVTVIADNYFGYCKKEVKTQISYSANLLGTTEEEHAGGTLAFPMYDLGDEFGEDLQIAHPPRRMEDAEVVLGHSALWQPEGHAYDRTYREIVYVPETARFDLNRQEVTWTQEGRTHVRRLAPEEIYVYPWGYQVRMFRPSLGRAWRLLGTVGEPTHCHKPCTVSGGGKSEISKPISDAILHGPVFVVDLQKDADAVEALLAHDYSARFRPELNHKPDHRPILSPERSLGSVIKLLTPSRDEYTDAYNAWLRSIPPQVKELLFVLKRFYRPSWGSQWREKFSVDVINGVPGNELKLGRRKLVTQYLRVGYAQDGSWRVFGLRKDFHPAFKIQTEDDITASVVVPVVPGATGEVGVRADRLSSDAAARPAVKFVHNCEYRLFQRPDDAIHRGYDHAAEADFARPGSFFSNYEPLTRERARAMVDDAIGLDLFTEPMRATIRAVADGHSPARYFVSNDQPRLVDGKPSKNPRYLQTRPDLLTPREVHLAHTATRLSRRVPAGEPALFPVDAVLCGRRNNPPDRAAGVPALCCHNPVHHYDLPELLIEVISSMTGRSPSTTGAGSEGALTKGPFNCLLPIHDLNQFLISQVRTGLATFITSAGTIGPEFRVDHDISLLMPEVWARMTPEEREPRYLIEHGMLEPCADLAAAQLGSDCRFRRPGRLLGHRITQRFVNAFFGRVFTSPELVFAESALRPELQSPEIFRDSLATIVLTVHRVARIYFEDGSIDEACPPLRTLLTIMRDGESEALHLDDPAFRQSFSADALLNSDWYRQRRSKLEAEAERARASHRDYLRDFLDRPSHRDEAERLGVEARLESL